MDDQAPPIPLLTRMEDHIVYPRAALLTITAIILASRWLPEPLVHEDLDTTAATEIIGNFLCFHLIGLISITAIIWATIPSGQRSRALGMHRAPTLGELREAIVTTMMVIPITYMISGLTLYGMRSFDIAPAANPVVEWLTTAPANVLVVLVAGSVLLAPVAEELMFRLVAFRAIQSMIGTTPALWLTSWIFAVFHLIPEQIVPLFILAMTLQRALLRTDTIWIPIAIHALFNGFAVGLAMTGRYLGG